MCHKLLTTVSLIVSLPIFVLAAPAQAQGHGGPHWARRHHHRPHPRMLPPEVPYRDPSVDLRPRGRPDFLIHAYLPRFTEVPMYNEPPAHFPQR